MIILLIYHIPLIYTIRVLISTNRRKLDLITFLFR